MKNFLQWVVEAGTASSQQIVVLLRTEAKSERLQTIAILFASTDDSFLRKAGVKQVSPIVRAFTAVQTYAASDARVAQLLFTLTSENAFFSFS